MDAKYIFMLTFVGINVTISSVKIKKKEETPMNNTKTMLIRLIAMLLVGVSMFSIASCSALPFGKDDTTDETPDNTTDDGKNDNQNDDNQSTACQHESKTEGKCDKCGEICPITIAEAIQIAAANPDGSTERYYIRATVKTLSNPQYGEMTIRDAFLQL